MPSYRQTTLNHRKTQSRGQKATKPRIVPHQLNQHFDLMINNASLNKADISRKSFIRAFVTEAYRFGHWTPQEIALVTGISVENVGSILTMDISQYAASLGVVQKAKYA